MVDFHSIEEQHLQILNAIKTDSEGLLILNSLGNPIQDLVLVLILTISIHFIVDHAKLLSNLKHENLGGL